MFDQREWGNPCRVGFQASTPPPSWQSTGRRTIRDGEWPSHVETAVTYRYCPTVLEGVIGTAMHWLFRVFVRIVSSSKCLRLLGSFLHFAIAFLTFLSGLTMVTGTGE